MKKPVLIIMAAGMGSRYGGLKQMDPVDDNGNAILHYSVYDAAEAGFETVIFVIKKENEADFRTIVADKLKDKVNVKFAFQDINDIPEGQTVPEGRVKPWGTGHAVRACRDLIDAEPFVVINSDDYYGRDAFKLMYDFLIHTGQAKYAMVGFKIGNTVTDSGYVARGVCTYDDNNTLTSIVERTHIEKLPDGAAFTEDEGKTWTHLPDDTLVSMNFWGFTSEFMQEADERFAGFLKETVISNPMKGEYFLPSIVWQLIEEKKAEVKVLSTADKWFGVTYKEDKPVVVASLKKMRDEGFYKGL